MRATMPSSVRRRTEAVAHSLREFFMGGPAKRALWKMLRNLDRHDAPRAASAIAFDAFLSLIPVLAMTGWVFGKLHQRGSTLVIPLESFAPAPVAALAGSELLRLSDAGAIALAPLSLIAFVWVGSGGLSTAMAVCETIFAAHHRSWWRRRSIAMVCVLGLLVAVPLLTWLTVWLIGELGPIAGGLLTLLVPGAVLLGGIIGFYRIAIRRHVSIRRRLLPGALVTLSLWGLTSLVFTGYVRTLSRYTTLYGGLAAVAMLLFWLWLLALALLVGGEVNAELEGVRNRDEDVPSAWRPES